jgi:peptide/nickel transport system permease protein
VALPEQTSSPTELEPIPIATGPRAVEAGAFVPGPDTAGDEAALSTSQLAWRRFKRHRMAMICAVILVILGSAALFARWISAFDPNQINAGPALSGPSLAHPLGTDNLGRDEFSRVLYGGRISLLIGMTVAPLASLMGSVLGAIAGYYGRWVDNLLMRVTDLFLSMPFLVILIVASRLAVFNGVRGIILLLALFFWMGNARIVRGVVLSLKEKEFVESARASGASNPRIIFLQIMPNCLGPILVNLTLDVAEAILTESALSFLGFGVQPPTPTWGNLLNDAQNFTLISPWLVWFPGLAILITVLCVNFLGDGLRDALDPYQRLGAV